MSDYNMISYSIKNTGSKLSNSRCINMRDIDCWRFKLNLKELISIIKTEYSDGNDIDYFIIHSAGKINAKM